MKSLFTAALGGALFLSAPACAQSLPSPQVATPATTDNSAHAANTAWVKSLGYLTSAPVTSVAGATGAVTAAEIATALASASIANLALTGAPTVNGLPVLGASGTWTAGECLEAASGPAIVVSGAACASGSTYTLPDATATTLGGVTVSTGLAVSSGALSVSYGTAAGTAAEGNDSRITGALQATMPPAGIVASTGTALSDVTIGSGLSYSGGTLSATGSTYTLPDATATTLGGVTVSTGLAVSSGALSVSYGTAAGTAAEGNDSRITGALQATMPAAGIVASTGTALSDVTIGSGLSYSGGTLSATGSTYTLPDATATTLGGITVSTGLAVSSGALSVSYGTAAGTAAEGNDSRITGALQATMPSAGIVASTGTALSDVTIGSGLSYSGGTLSATASAGIPPAPGVWLRPHNSIVGVSPGGTTLLAIPFNLKGAGAPTALSVIADTTPSSSVQVVLGIYADSAGVPGPLVANADTGTLTLSAAGALVGPLTGVATLAPGRYWLVSLFSAAPGINLAGVGNQTYENDNFGELGLTDASGPSGNILGYTSTGVVTFGALPASFPAGAYSTSVSMLPLVYVKF